MVAGAYESEILRKATAPVASETARDAQHFRTDCPQLMNDRSRWRFELLCPILKVLNLDTPPRDRGGAEAEVFPWVQWGAEIGLTRFQRPCAARFCWRRLWVQPSRTRTGQKRGRGQGREQGLTL